MKIIRLKKTSRIIKPSNAIMSSIEKKFSKYNRNCTLLQQRTFLNPLKEKKHAEANWSQTYPKIYR